MMKENLINGASVVLHALKYKVTSKRIPLMVSISLTGRCNLKCEFCYVGLNPPKEADASTDKLLGYIDQFAALGTRIFLLQGGEPTLRKDIGQIIARVKEHGRYCRMSTNGVLVADRIDSLIGLDQISFSLDGLPEIVDRIRGKGVYAKVIHGMEKAYEKKIPFQIHAPLIKESALNRDSILHVLELARRFDTRVSFCVTAVSGAENTTAVGTADLTAAEIQNLYRFLIDLKEKDYPISNTINSLRKTLLWPINYAEIGFRHNLPADFDYVECRHGRLICWLDAEDTLYPCPTTFSRPEYAVKVINGDVEQAWEELGRRLTCVACSGSDESTTFLALKFEDLVQTGSEFLKSQMLQGRTRVNGKKT